MKPALGAMALFPFYYAYARSHAAKIDQVPSQSLEQCTDPAFFYFYTSPGPNS